MVTRDDFLEIARTFNTTSEEERDDANVAFFLKDADSDVRELVKEVMNTQTLEGENVFLLSAETYLLAACIVSSEASAKDKSKLIAISDTISISIRNEIEGDENVALEQFLKNAQDASFAAEYYRAFSQIACRKKERVEALSLCNMKLQFYIMNISD